MAGKSPRGFKTAALFTLFFVLLAGIGTVIYCFYLSFEIEKRFSGRRWQIPSRVYSDVTLLYPGQRMNKALFFSKLKDLGYKKVSQPPKIKGEMRFFDSVLSLFLKDVQRPGMRREGYLVRIDLNADRIEAIRREDTREPLDILEIEPEALMLFFGDEREQRRLVSIDQVPEHLIHAVLAIEDNRFFQHPGIDPIGMVRALLTNLRSGSIRQGGSTLTQQLAKNYFLTPERTFSRKIREVLIALTMEALYDKKTILEIYLNEIYFGQKGAVSVNGIGEAADFYFAKSVEALSLDECALLAGLIKAPNRYTPHSHPDAAKSRRNRVLHAMFQEGYIDQKQLKDAISIPIRTAAIERYGKRAPYFMDYLSEQLAHLYPKEVLSGSGFSIYTTLDTQVQRAAENALSEGLKRLENHHPELKRPKREKRLQGGVIVMHPKTGAVLAMVGGRDYSISQFNRIT
ncbi:MAG: transglycosylase domain-containing protein, partial [Deltaproteobacteria bacterium]|nr:transglycosylase domain-containing protein [Deltaproteobacteria bacterium]